MTRRLRQLTDWVFRQFTGRDYFISYTRRDAAPYASRLAARLGETHSVYLDQLDTPRGSELPPALRRALMRASTTVLVGSPGALHSPWVQRELESFLPTGRPVLLVDVDGALEGVPWTEAPWRDLVGVYRQRESAGAFADGDVSADVLAYLRDSFTYTRQSQRLRRNSLLAVATLAATAIGATVLVRQAQTEVAEAGVLTRAAEAQRTRAEGQTADAQQREQVANARARDAATLATQAETRAAEAGALERAARAEASNQQRIALSRRLSGESVATLATQPDLALLLAAHAWRASPTADAYRALFDGATRFPAVTAVRSGRHDAPIWHVAASPDGRIVASRDVSGGTVLWETRTRRFRQTVAPPLSGTGLGAIDFGGIAVSPTGKLLAIAGVDDVQLWDVDEGRRVGVVDRSPRRVAFLGPALLGLDDGHAITAWDVSDPAAPAAGAWKVGFDPDLHAFAADARRGVWVVRDDDGLLVCRVGGCDGVDGRIHDDRFSEGPRDMALSVGTRTGLIAALLSSGDIGLWDVATRRPVAVLRPELPPVPHNLQVQGLAFGPDGDELAVIRSGGIVMFDLSRVREEATSSQRRIPYQGTVTTVTFAGDGLLALGQADGTMVFLDARGRAAIASRYPRPGAAASGQVSLETASGDGSAIAAASEDGLVLWRPARPASLRRLIEGQAPGATIEALSLSTDGRLVAAVLRTPARGRELTVWDDSGAARYRESLAPEPRVLAFAFGGTATNPTLAVAQTSGEMRFFDVTNAGRPRLVFTDPRGASEDIAFDAHGTLAAAADVDTIRIWDLRQRRSTRLRTDLDVDAVAFSDDGQRLLGYVSGDATATIVRWDLATGTVSESTTLFAARDSLASVFQGAAIDLNADPVFSRDGRLMAFASTDRIVLWDLEPGAVLGSIPLPMSPDRVAFSADGTQLFVFDADGFSVVDVGPERLVSHACRVAGRDITNAERGRFLGGQRGAVTCAVSAATPDRTSRAGLKLEATRSAIDHLGARSRAADAD